MRKFPNVKLKEFRVFDRLKTPEKIQDFVDGLRINFERDGETERSPLMVLRRKEAHCFEGALLAAAALWRNGERPLLVNLRTVPGDYGHVLAVFRRNGKWGAITKTNHAALRYRDPVFRSLRELVMSYFNEYFMDNGKKTLRAYSLPFDIAKYGDEWLVSEKNLSKILFALMNSPHVKILDENSARRLRLAGPLEIKAGKLTEWKKR
jgi:hypothetical protein